MGNLSVKTLSCWLALALCGSAEAASPAEQIEASLTAAGYRCEETPDHAGIFCQDKGRSNYIVVPRGVESFERTLVYAHGLIGVCKPGASGEDYLRNTAPELARLRAVAVMPYRPKANDNSFPLAAYIARMDKLLGKELPLVLAGHSAAGPFFATAMSEGRGTPMLDRVESILLLDAIYGDQTNRWKTILSKNKKLKLKIVSTTTAERSKALTRSLAPFASRISLELFNGDHCSVPKRFFHLVNAN